MVSAGATVLEFSQCRLTIVVGAKRTRQDLIQKLMGTSKDSIIFLDVAVHKLSIGFRNVSILFRHIGSNVTQIGKHGWEHAFKENAGFVKPFDRKQKGSPGSKCFFDNRHVFLATSTIEKVNLTVGLRMDVLVDEFRIGEFAKAQTLCDTVDLFEMSMEEVARNESLDRIPNVTDGVDARVFMSPGKIKRKFVVTHAANPRMAANDFADVFASVLLGFQQ